MPVIVVVCEHRDDFSLATLLADRVIRERGPVWLRDSNLDLHRTWRGLPVSDSHVTFITWSQLKKLRKPAKSLGYKNLGWDAEACRKAIIATEAENRIHQIAALLLVRDLDGEPKRRQSLEAAPGERPSPFEIILATPNPEMEAWIFHSFVPGDSGAEKRLQALRQRVGFDPVTEAHRFSQQPRSREAGNRRGIKAALDHLLGESSGAREVCLAEARLEALEQHGSQSGLTAYLRELEDRLLPALTGERRPR